MGKKLASAFGGVLAFIVLAVHGSASQPPFTNSFGILYLGGGGYVVGANVSPTGVKFMRTDANFAYLWGTSDNQWHNVITQSSMPATDFGYYPTTGTRQVWQGGLPVSGYSGARADHVYDIASAPSNSSVAYMMWNGYVYVSTNVNPASPNSITWARTSYVQTPDNTGSNFKICGDKIAIDPNSPDHVLVGSAYGGLWETTNGRSGASATWTQVSSSVVPLAGATQLYQDSGSPWAKQNIGYNITFDPSSGTNASGLTNKFYVYTPGTSETGAGVYATTNGLSASLTKTAGGPSVTLCHMRASPNGDIFAVTVETSGHLSTIPTAYNFNNVWKYRGGTWSNVYGPAGVLTVAINPSNALHVVVGGGSGFLYPSTDGGATFSGPYTYAVAAGDTGWVTQYAPNSQSSGDLWFDPLNNDHLIYSGGQSVWNTIFPIRNFKWLSRNKGIEEAISGNIVVGAPNSPTVGFQDIATMTFNTLNNAPQANVGAIMKQFTLEYASNLAAPYLDQGFMIAKISNNFANGQDISGYSSDQFRRTYYPFNTWNSGYIAAGNVASNDSGLVRVTVPDASTLSTWSAGSGTIVCVNTDTFANSGNTLMSGTGRCYPITKISSTQFDLQGSTWNAADSSFSGNYLLYAPPASRLSDWNGDYTITNITNDGSGHIRVWFASDPGGFSSNNGLVCIAGVLGTTEANGCWMAIHTGNTLVLKSSTFMHTYAGGGDLTTWEQPGGAGSAAADRNNFVITAGDESVPRCTTDGGKTWMTLSFPNLPVANATVLGGPYSAGTSTLTINTNHYNSYGGIGGIHSTMQIHLDDGRLFADQVSSTSLAGRIMNGGSGYTPGTHKNVPLITRSGSGKSGHATITVSTGGVVTNVQFISANGDTGGNDYVAGDTVGASGLGSGSGFVFVVNAYNVTFANPLPRGSTVSNTNIITSGTGWADAAYVQSRRVAADTITPNTFYAINANGGMYKWTNCGTPSLVASGNIYDGTTQWQANAGGINSVQLKPVPGEAGHLFWVIGNVGGGGASHPVTNARLWRTCNGASSSVTWQAMPNVWEPQTVGFGKTKPGQRYPAIYFAGWYSSDGNPANATFGIWRSVDDPNHGVSGSCTTNATTFTQLGTYPNGWPATGVDISGDPWIYGEVYMSGGSAGQFTGMFN